MRVRIAIVVAMVGGTLIGTMAAQGDQFWVGLTGSVLCAMAFVLGTWEDE
jgi:hypothetical protein